MSKRLQIAQTNKVLFLHLLSIPREDVSVGYFYVYDGQEAIPAGPITKLLEPPYEIPEIKTGEKMADVSLMLSRGVEVNIGIELLENFLSVFGIETIIQRIQNVFESKGAQFLKFRFANIVRDSAYVIDIASNLVGHKVRKDSPLHVEGRKYYMLTAVARSHSIAVIAENNNNQSINVGMGIIGLVDSSTGVSVQNSGTGEVTFSGRKNLVFGVELHELNYKNEMFRINAVEKLIGLRGPRKYIRRPAFIGDPKEGDIFI